MNKKVLLSLFLALMTCVPLRAEESDIRMADGATFIVGDYEYIFNTNGAALRSVDILRHLDLTAAEIDVPATVEYGSVEFYVLGIREGAFSSHFNLENVNIADGIFNLRPCFADCPKLHSLRLPESIGGIPDYFLKGTYIKELHIEYLRGVGKYAFSNDYLNTLQIDKCGVGSLPEYSFAGTNLEEITLPDNILDVGSYAFAGNRKLRKIKFGPKIQSFGDLIFYECPKLLLIELATRKPPKLVYRYVFTGGRDNYDWICETFHDVSYGGSQFWEPWFVLIPEESIPVYQSVKSGDPYGYWKDMNYVAIENQNWVPELELKLSETSISPEIGSSVTITAGIPWYWDRYFQVQNKKNIPGIFWQVTDKSIIKVESIKEWYEESENRVTRLSGQKATLLALEEGECDIVLTVSQYPELREVIHVSTRPSGVDGVEQDEVRQDVYNLQGVRVKANATKADIDALPAGIYIIGGKKIVKTN